jgi:Flp pilus assembly pilin Flp
MSPRAIEEEAGAALAGYALIAAVIAIATMPLVVNHGGAVFTFIKHVVRVTLGD